MISEQSNTVGAFNPYRASAGPELDRLVHARLFGENTRETPTFSTSASESSKIVSQLKRKYGRKVVVGKTSSRPPKYFARLETDPSTSVEALAESEPLAICRLAAVLTAPR